MKYIKNIHTGNIIYKNNIQNNIIIYKKSTVSTN